MTRIVEFVTNSGIGDLSWIYSMVRQIPKITQGEVKIRISCCDAAPQRAHQLGELLPDVEWGGYTNTTNQEVYFQHVPPRWPYHWGLDPLIKLSRVNLTPCTHFEANGTLADWLVGSGLQPDYHYPIKGNFLDTSKGAPYPPVYTKMPHITASISSRDLNGSSEWHIWSEAEWFAFLYRVAVKTDISHFMLIGAEYDRESTEEVGRMLTAHGLKVEYCLGKELEQVLHRLLGCSYYFAYQSGLAVLADVLNVPCLTLLPAHLPNVAKSYADPKNLDSGQYWGMATPTVEQAAEWFEEVGMKHVRR